MIEESQTNQEDIQKDRNTICIKKNTLKDGCTITAHNLYETFTCENCEHKQKWNCISLKLSDIMDTKRQ